MLPPPRRASTIAQEKKVEDVGGVLTDLDGRHYYGHWSLFGLAHSRDQKQVEAALPRIQNIFSDPAEAGLLEEKRGAVSGYLSCFPGQPYNVRKLWLRGDHKANLSFVYSPFAGHPWSEDLQDEYTLVYETLQGTPFFFTPFVNGNGNTTILGGPARGKSLTDALFGAASWRRPFFRAALLSNCAVVPPFSPRLFFRARNTEHHPSQIFGCADNRACRGTRQAPSEGWAPFLTFSGAHGSEVQITARQANAFAVFEKQSIEVSAGDKLLLQANWRDKSFRATNGELVTVASVEPNAIKLEDGRQLPAAYRQFTHGYAVTAHKSQGKTVDFQIIAAERMAQDLFYVSASRGREGLTVITSDSLGLQESIGVSGDRQSASELARRAAAPVTAELDDFRLYEAQQQIAQRQRPAQQVIQHEAINHHVNHPGISIGF